MNDRPPSPGELDATTVTRLMRLGVGKAGRPVDELIACLESQTGNSWLAVAVTRPPLNRLVAPDLSGLRICASEELERIKSDGKRMAADHQSQDERLRGLLAYFLALAAGKAQHQAWLSGQPPEQIVSVLGDLATVLPGGLQDAVASVVAAEQR